MGLRKFAMHNTTKSNTCDDFYNRFLRNFAESVMATKGRFCKDCIVEKIRFFC